MFDFLEPTQKVQNMTKSSQQKKFLVKILSPLDAAAEQARDVEREVFLDAFGNTPELLHKEYDPYEPLSVFITVFDMEASPIKVAGMVRVLVGSPQELKSVKDLESGWQVDFREVFAKTSDILNRPVMVDVATLAVSKEYRARATSSTVSMALYHSISRLTRELGLQTLVTVYDLKVFRLLNRLFLDTWFTFEGIAPQEYLGSPASVPSWCDNDELERRLLQSRPQLAEEFFGTEPSELVAFPDWAQVRADFTYLL